MCRHWRWFIPRFLGNTAGFIRCAMLYDKVRKADQEKGKKDLHRISHAESRQLPTQAYGAFCKKYRKVYPGAVKSLESEIESLLSFYQVKLSPTERKGRGAQEL